MNRRERRKKGESLSEGKNNSRFASNNKIENVNQLESISAVNERATDNCYARQGKLLQESSRLRSRQSSWSSFGGGLFWGAIFGFTAIFSASCGVALTKIDGIEKIIARTINDDSSTSQSFTQYEFNRLINVLILETKPKQESIVQSSQGLVNQSKTILLLQFDPQSNTAKIINIPLDSRVKIPGFGWGTINDANKYGGTSLVSQSVAQLLNGITIHRYVRATPSTFNRLIDSGKITFNNCDSHIENCSNIAERIARQEVAVETIRQRLNIPIYFESFENIVSKTRSNLDTNLSIPETMSIANFIKELESDDIRVDLVSGYTRGKSIDLNNKLHKSNSTAADPALVKSIFQNERIFKNLPIAVQNTTDSPELGMHLVSYLRRLNFRDVYLVKHIPLKLNKTKIVLAQSQLSRAKQLKNTIGFGKLELKPNSKQKSLTIQIGEDVRYLFSENPTYQF